MVKKQFLMQALFTDCKANSAAAVILTENNTIQGLHRGHGLGEEDTLPEHNARSAFSTSGTDVNDSELVFVHIFRAKPNCF